MSLLLLGPLRGHVGHLGRCEAPNRMNLMLVIPLDAVPTVVAPAPFQQLPLLPLTILASRQVPLLRR